MARPLTLTNDDIVRRARARRYLRRAEASHDDPRLIGRVLRLVGAREQVGVA